MREAYAAQPDDDFDLPSVVRRKTPAQTRRPAPKPQRKAGLGERLISLALRNPRQVLAALILTGCGGAIAWNALLLQSARHPAPLFNASEPELEPEPDYAPVLSQPLPPVRPGTEMPEAYAPAPVEQSAPPPAAPRSPARGAIADMIRNGGAPSSAATAPSKVAPAPATVIVPARERAPTVRDPIGEIIRLGGPVPTPPANVGRPDAGDLVLSGQRALARLGYSVKVDGLMGPGTRQAIERFEQDRRMPVTGEFNARTVRALSSESGIAVQ